MELMNCRMCKRLFNYLSGDYICPSCKDALEKKFQEVKQFIEENPGQNIQQVSEACEVDQKQIKRWVREERLSFSDDSLVGLECERCGRMVHSGRFCNVCAGNLSDSMNALYQKNVEYKKKTVAAGKMRFLE